MQSYNVTIFTITINKREVVKKMKMVLRVLQSLMKVKTDNIVCNIMPSSLYTVDDAAHAFILAVKAKLAKGYFETRCTEILNHMKNHVS